MGTGESLASLHQAEGGRGEQGVANKRLCQRVRAPVAPPLWSSSSYFEPFPLGSDHFCALFSYSLGMLSQGYLILMPFFLWDFLGRRVPEFPP